MAYDSGGDSDRERDVNDEFFDREEELRGYNRQVWPLTHSLSVFYCLEGKRMTPFQDDIALICCSQFRSLEGLFEPPLKGFSILPRKLLLELMRNQDILSCVALSKELPGHS